MRVLAAGLFVWLGLVAMVGVVSSLRAFEKAPPWVLGGTIALVLLGLVAMSLWLFNPRGAGALHRKSAEEQIRELEKQGLLEERAFRARRAFGVEEFEDEGLHYYLELVEGGVLFLSGQYLYDYEPMTNDPDLNQPRTFPCSEFTVRRHRTEGYVVDIVRAGTVLEPEAMAPPFGKEVWGGIAEDGEVITARTYDELKAERGAGGNR